MNNFDVIIIGSGPGGLICGNILSKEGFRVCILEKHHTPGGNLQTFKRQDKKFETGVHYVGSLGEGQVLNRYWKYLGLMDHLPLKKLDEDAFDVVRIGDHEFPLAQDPLNFIEQLLPYFPYSHEPLKTFIKQTGEITAAFPLYKLETPTRSGEEHFRSASALEFFKNMGSNAHSLAGHIPLSGVLSGNNYLYGGNRATPLHTAALISHSFISGAYRVIGGSDQIATLLAGNITSCGGAVRTKKEAVQIQTMDHKYRVGTQDGEMFVSSLLISDIHPVKTLDLMPSSGVRPAFWKRIHSLRNTPASFILFLGMKPGTFPYFNKNYHVHTQPDVWNITPSYSPEWPTRFMLSTPCNSPGQEYADTVIILTYADFSEFSPWEHTATGRRGASYQEYKTRKAEKLLDFAEDSFPGLKRAIMHMEISTPLTYRDYTGTPEGSLYGIEKDYRNPLLTTLSPRTKIPNLFFTGQNINLHGILGVTISAVMTCGEILGIDSLLSKIRHA